MVRLLALSIALFVFAVLVAISPGRAGDIDYPNSDRPP